MTKSAIIYTFNKFGISLPSSGKSNWLNLEENIFYFVFSDSTKTKKMDKLSQYQFDMTNEVIVQRRLRKDGITVICYPNTGIPCLNVFSFDSLLNIASISEEA